MKIIALAGSPSKGRNSDSMLDAFIRGALSVQGIEVEKFYITDIPMQDFTFQNSTGVLPDESAFANLTQKIMAESRGLVIATPTYNFGVPAHLKNFIDRARFFALDMKEKTALGQPKGALGHIATYFLVSGGTPKWAQRLLFFTFPPFWLRGVFLYFGAKVYGAYYTGDVRAFENERILKTCEKRGRAYAQKLLRNAPHGVLENIFWRPPQVK